MKKQPLVYIVIPNFNAVAFLKKCLDSLMKITYKNCKILFMDDCSTDNSVEFVRKNYRKVDIIVNRENLSFAKTSNLGIKKALKEGAEYVLILNNDTTVRPDFLSRLVEFAEKNPKAGIITPAILEYDNNLIQAFGSKLDETGRAHMQHYHKTLVDLPDVEEADYLHGPAMLFRPEMLKKVGLYDEDFVFTYEDSDLCKRARECGYRIFTIKSSVIRHKGFSGVSVKKRTWKFLFINQRGRIRFVLLHFGALELLLFPFFEIAAIARLISKGVKREIIVLPFAYLWNLLNLPKTIRRRMSLYGASP